MSVTTILPSLLKLAVLRSALVRLRGAMPGRMATIAPSPLLGVSPFLLSAKVRAGSAAVPLGDARSEGLRRRSARVAGAYGEPKSYALDMTDITTGRRGHGEEPARRGDLARLRFYRVVSRSFGGTTKIIEDFIRPVAVCLVTRPSTKPIVVA